MSYEINSMTSLVDLALDISFLVSQLLDLVVAHLNDV